MEKEKQKELKEDKRSQFRWPKKMSKALLEILADEVKKGNRPKSTFRSSTLTSVARQISEKFGVECHPSHVDNHLKTVRSTWEKICKVRGNSGFGWDDNLKMITCDSDVYDTYVEKNPELEDYLNKKIPLYEEMALVVGKDLARGDCAKSFSDINMDSVRESPVDGNVESETASKEKENMALGKQTSSSFTSGTPQRRKRAHDDDSLSEVSQISTQLGEVASALKRFSEDRLDVNKLYEEIMKVEGVDEASLSFAFDYLVEHEMLGKAFLAKNASLRKFWVTNFLKKNPM